MSKADPFWRHSQCLGSWLHRFVIANNYGDCVHEVCQICGQSQFFRIIDGQCNNLEYLDYHLRQALVPQHKYYSHEYLRK